MAPELLEEERPRPSRETDIYAFGGLMLAVMSRKPPFGGLREVTILRRISQGQTPTSDEHPDLPTDDEFWNLMRCCWDADPTARPTMREVLWELWGYISYEQLSQGSTAHLPPTTEAGGREHGHMDLDVSTAVGIPTCNIFDPVHSPKNGSLSDITNTDQTSNTIAGVLTTARRMEGSLEVKFQVVPVSDNHTRAIAKAGPRA